MMIPLKSREFDKVSKMVSVCNYLLFSLPLNEHRVICFGIRFLNNLKSEAICKHSIIKYAISLQFLSSLVDGILSGVI